MGMLTALICCQWSKTQMFSPTEHPVNKQWATATGTEEASQWPRKQKDRLTLRANSYLHLDSAVCARTEGSGSSLGAAGAASQVETHCLNTPAPRALPMELHDGESFSGKWPDIQLVLEIHLSRTL